MADDPPAGWYPDPNDPDQARYWDGKGWTDYTGPREGRAAGPPRIEPPPEAPVTVAPPVGDARPRRVDQPKRLGTIAWWAYGLLALTLIASLVVIPIALDYGDKIQTQIDDRSVTREEALDAEDAYYVGSGIYGFASLAAIVGFLVWWYRAYSNLPGITGRPHRFGRGWSIGAWFIPIFNLWRPKQIGNDIWRSGDAAARGNAEWTGLPVSKLVHWWWALFLLSGFLGAIGGVFLNVDPVLSESATDTRPVEERPGDSDLEQEYTSAVIGAASSAITVFAAAAAIIFIRRASERQDARIADGETGKGAT
jgi:eukaryotic-like serine/threonine-protein kinase